MDDNLKEFISNIITKLDESIINISVDGYNKLTEGFVDKQSTDCLLPIFIILNNAFSNNMLFSKEEISKLISLYNIVMYG